MEAARSLEKLSKQVPRRFFVIEMPTDQLILTWCDTELKPSQSFPVRNCNNRSEATQNRGEYLPNGLRLFSIPLFERLPCRLLHAVGTIRRCVSDVYCGECYGLYRMEGKFYHGGDANGRDCNFDQSKCIEAQGQAMNVRWIQCKKAKDKELNVPVIEIQPSRVSLHIYRRHKKKQTDIDIVRAKENILRRVEGTEK